MADSTGAHFLPVSLFFTFSIPFPPLLLFLFLLFLPVFSPHPPCIHPSIVHNFSTRATCSLPTFSDHCPPAPLLQPHLPDLFAPRLRSTAAEPAFSILYVLPTPCPFSSLLITLPIHTLHIRSSSFLFHTHIHTHTPLPSPLVILYSVQRKKKSTCIRPLPNNQPPRPIPSTDGLWRVFNGSRSATSLCFTSTMNTRR